MDDQELMAAAIAEARKGLSEGGIPIGSALARDGELLAVGSTALARWLLEKE